MMKQWQLVLSTASVGILAGVIATNAKLGLGVLALAVPAGMAGYIVSDTKATNRFNVLDRDCRDTKRKLEVVNSRLKLVSEEKAQQWDMLSHDKNTLIDKLAELQKALISLGSDHKSLTEKAALIEGEKSKDTATIQDLENRLQYLNTHFAETVERQANEFFQEYRAKELNKLYTDYDSMMQEAMSIIQGLQCWGEKVAHGHQSKSEIIRGLASNYNQNLDTVGSAFATERDSYLEQIELLQEKIGHLQQELAGDLLEPEFGDFGFSPEGKVANAIARDIFSELGIPLAVRGFYARPDGVVEIGYSYSHSSNPEALVATLKQQSAHIARRLGIHKIVGVKKLEITDCLVLSYRLAPSIKDSEVKLQAGSPEEFIKYVISHPIRYRLIADPGSGKTPTTAVMLSEILKVGGTLGNTAKGKKIPNTLITVSCPDVASSQKDSDYPLEAFLKYGDTTAAVKSFADALADWEYRKRDTNYAANFFQVWIWDELDNTLNNANDPVATGKKFKELLKQAHHTGVGWIVSGQSVMTKQIPGFFDNDRDLFTEIIIGSTKIRKYLEKYGKKTLSEALVKRLLANLEQLDGYLEDKNSMITDDARTLRLALILDSRSPKLYFLPNFDSVEFDSDTIEDTRKLADQFQRQFAARSRQTANQKNGDNAQNSHVEGVGEMAADPPFPTMGSVGQNLAIAHCPHCGKSGLDILSDGRYRCSPCNKRFVKSKAVWK